MKKVVLTVLLLLFPTLLFGAEQSSNKKVKIIYPAMDLTVSATRTDWGYTLAALFQLIAVYNAHGIVYDIQKIPKNSTGWITKYNLKDLDGQGYGLLTMIGAHNSTQNNSLYYNDSSHLIEAWHPDSTNVPILVLSVGDRDPQVVTGSFWDRNSRIDIGVQATVDNSLRIVLDNGGSDVNSCKLFTSYKGTGVFNFIPFWSDNNTPKFLLCILEPGWAGNPTYNFDSVTPLIWIKENYPLNVVSTPGDTVMAWRVNRTTGNNPNPIVFGNIYGDVLQTRMAYAWLAMPLSLNAADGDLYYKSILHTVVMDDYGEGGNPGLSSPLQKSDGCTAADMEAMFQSFRDYGINKVVLAGDPWMARSENNLTTIDNDGDLFTGGTPNEGLAMWQVFLRNRDIAKLTKAYHSHRVWYLKGSPNTANTSDLSDRAMLDNYNDWHLSIKATADSLGIKPSDYVPIFAFAADRFRNINDVTTDPDTWEDMLIILTDSIGVKGIRQGSQWGKARPGAGGAVQVGNNAQKYQGAVIHPKFNLVVTPHLFYHDSYLNASGGGDSMFVKAGADSLEAMMKSIDGTQSLGKPYGAVSTVIHPFYSWVNPNDGIKNSGNSQRRGAGYIPWGLYGNLHTWHAYNWQPRGGQRRGVEWVKFYTDQLNILNTLAGVNDLWKWTWGEQATFMSPKTRPPFGTVSRDGSNTTSANPLTTTSR